MSGGSTTSGRLDRRVGVGSDAGAGAAGSSPRAEDLRARWVERMEGADRVDLSEHPEVARELIDAFTPRDMRLQIHAGSELRLRDGEIEVDFSALVLAGPAGLGSRAALSATAATAASTAGAEEECGTIERRLRSATGSAVHTLFELPVSARDDLRGRQVLRASADVYRRLGLDRITLNAVNVGRYVWAAAGFSFTDAGDRAQVVRAVQELAEEVGAAIDDLDRERAEPFEIARVQSSEPLTLGDWFERLGVQDAPEDADELRMPVENVGKILLLSDSVPGWSGKLHLDAAPGNLGLQAFDIYTQLQP